MIFQFKQFAVDQSGCAMKINTDGVLLGALVQANDAQMILDIGTGTGVIALMMAQRFLGASIDAVELDEAAAATAGRNFNNSGFPNQPQIYHNSFQQYFQGHAERKYDLIISNPPFFLNSLEAAGDKKNLARHTNHLFFEELIKAVSASLTADGSCWLVLPLQTATLVKKLATLNNLFIQHIITLHSFAESDAHREIIAIGPTQTNCVNQRFVIYDAPKIYSGQYQQTLKDFFTIF